MGIRGSEQNVQIPNTKSSKDPRARFQRARGGILYTDLVHSVMSRPGIIHTSS